MYTSFGRFCKELRLENAELLYDMAKRLDVSSAFLSKVENGKAKPPVKWENDIAVKYKLTEEQKERLKRCIEEARKSTVIDIKDLSIDDRDMMLKFARKLNDMDAESKEKFKELLK